MKRILALCVLALLAWSPVARAGDTRPTVAVLYFDYSGKDEGLSVLRKGLAQMLISDLAGLDSVRLVERDRLEEVLAELKLAESGKIDPQTAARVGKLLGARYLVLGSYFDLMKTLRADARVVEVETGKVLQAIGAQGTPEEFLTVEQKLSEGIHAILATRLAPAASPAPSPAPAPAPSPSPAPPPSPAPAPAPLRPRVPRPSSLKTRTAVAYARALDALDRGDRPQAKKHLTAVVKEQPDFRLAALDLDRLAR